MHHLIAPTLKKWYQDTDKNEIFMVVAQSLEEDFVEIQYFSGDIAELDFETWFSLHLNIVPAPKDCSGPFDISSEELGYDSENTFPRKWNNPLSFIEPARHYDNYIHYDRYERYDKYDKYFDNFDRTHFFEDND